MTKVLHAGCSTTPLPAWLGSCQEVRLDIDPRCKPDICTSLTNLGEIGPFDAVFCSHVLEHLHPYEGAKALEEFKRVLKQNGIVLILVPNLEQVKPTNEVVYESMAGPITGLDMIYGMRKFTAWNKYMRHQNGFIEETLREMLEEAGFEEVRVTKDEINLFAAGVKCT